MPKESPVVYVVSDASGFLADWNQGTGLTHTAIVEDAAMFSRDGAVSLARRLNGGQAFSYNMDTRKLRKVNR